MAENDQHYDDMLLPVSILQWMFSKEQKTRHLKILLGVRFKTQFAHSSWLLAKEIANWWQLAIFYVLNALWLIFFTVVTVVVGYAALVMLLSL
jgi:hypothetical protein